jgi:hypothetical protein
MRFIKRVEIDKRGKGLGCYCENSEKAVLSDRHNPSANRKGVSAAAACRPQRCKLRCNVI